MLARVVILLALAALGSFSPATPVYDTIIVGMGASGCAAASVLCEAGKRVLALEAMNRVGGRVNTVPFGDGIVEIGAEWIHGERPNPVYDLALRHNISIRSQDLSLNIFRSDGTQKNRDAYTELMNFAFEAAKDPSQGKPAALGQYMTERITEYMSTKYPELLEDQGFVDQLLHSVEVMFNCYEGSSSWNDLSTYGQYQDLEGDPYMSWHELGYKTAFELMLNTYNGGPGYPTLNLQLQKEVTNISYPQDPSQDVEVTCRDGTVYKARNVIVTVSLGVLKAGHTTLFSPALPTSKTIAIDNISMGLIGKVVLLFPNPWWELNSTDEINFLWTKEDKLALGEDWAVETGGATRPMGNKNALTFWFYGNSAKLIETLPADEIKSKCMAMLRRFMGNVTVIPEPLDMMRSGWHSNPFTRGTYSYDNVRTPIHPNDRSYLAEPIVDSSGTPRVLFAGEATNTIHFGTVHGAAETGYREGNRLVKKTSVVSRLG